MVIRSASGCWIAKRVVRHLLRRGGGDKYDPPAVTVWEVLGDSQAIGQAIGQSSSPLRWFVVILKT